jgi:hypothetical protein
MKQFLVLFGFLSLINIIQAQSQNDELIQRIKEQLGSSEKKKMAEVEKYQLNCNNEKAEAEKLEGSSRKKALRKWISASENQGIANNKAYKLYREDLEKFNLKRHDSARVIDRKLVRAKKIMKLSREKRENALKLTRDDDVYSLLKDADDLELKAFKDVFFVYSLFLVENKNKNDLSVKSSEKNLVKEENKTDETGKTEQEKPVNNEIKTIVKSEESKKNTIENNSNNSITEVNKSKENLNASELNAKITEEQNNETDIKAKVYFKIQIAASKTQLSVEQLVKNFPTKEVLNVEVDGDWYKYSIRKKFTNYDEAIEYRTNLKIKGAFIIAFKDGKKVSIEEALKKDIVENTKPIVVANEQIDNSKQKTEEKNSYRLQIGFSTNPLSAQEIRQFKNGGKEVLMVDCGSWFIYTVGEFETENAANQFKRARGLSEAEVVKFINGKPVNN